MPSAFRHRSCRRHCRAIRGRPSIRPIASVVPADRRDRRRRIPPAVSLRVPYRRASSAHARSPAGTPDWRARDRSSSGRPVRRLRGRAGRCAAPNPSPRKTSGSSQRPARGLTAAVRVSDAAAACTPASLRNQRAGARGSPFLAAGRSGADPAGRTDRGCNRRRGAAASATCRGSRRLRGGRLHAPRERVRSIGLNRTRRRCRRGRRSARLCNAHAFHRRAPRRCRRRCAPCYRSGSSVSRTNCCRPCRRAWLARSSTRRRETTARVVSMLRSTYRGRHRAPRSPAGSLRRPRSRLADICCSRSPVRPRRSARIANCRRRAAGSERRDRRRWPAPPAHRFRCAAPRRRPVVSGRSRRRCCSDRAPPRRTKLRIASRASGGVPAGIR